MAGNNGPKIVTDGLVFCANAADKKSYIGSGTSWRDLTQNGANGTLNGGMGYSANNGGYLTAGTYNSNQYASWGTSLSQVNFTSSNFSVSVMTRPDAENFAGGHRGLFAYGASGSSGYYLLINKVVSNKLSFFTNASGNQQETRSSDFSVYSGKWTLVTVIRTGSSVKIYANTTDITETAGTHVNPASNTTNPLVLASATQFGTFDFTFTGFYSSFMIYNKALSASELSRNFDSMRRRFDL